MSKIDQLIAELQLKKKKVLFLEHILTSAKDFEDEDFKEVKDDVVQLLEKFTKETIAEIEDGEKPLTKQPEKPVETKVEQPTKKPEQNTSKEPAMSVHEKATFAMANRHLAGKKVDVLNDKNAQIVGEVVGLDAPYVIVKTDTGHRIKVPVDNINVRPG